MPILSSQGGHCENKRHYCRWQHEIAFWQVGLVEQSAAMKRFLPAITIFLGSFLSFGVQPMVGRTLLPVFGGTAAVWVVCLCAFQMLLLGGYWVAHTMAGCGSAELSRTRAFHAYLLLLLGSATWVVFVAFRGRAVLALSVSGSFPAIQVLVCVAVLVGIPYALLAANSSLVQALSGGEYRLYAVSNLGSLAGLLAYPFLFEPHVGLTAQWVGFGAGLLVYAGLLWVVAQRAAHDSREMPDVAGESSDSKESEESDFKLLWLALPALSCFLLNALTTHVTLDVMPMPLVWTGSLSLFLLSYVFGFSGIAERGTRLLAPLAAASVAAAAWLHGKPLAQVKLPLALSIYGIPLLVGCTFLHSWLYAVRPQRKRLTRYYLFQAIGGAVGGLAASLIFPVATRPVAEYPLALGVLVVAAVAGTLASHGTARSCSGHNKRSPPDWNNGCLVRCGNCGSRSSRVVLAHGRTNGEASGYLSRTWFLRDN